jgi:HEPN domain-containing protein
MYSDTNREESMANRAQDWFAQAEYDVKLAETAQAAGSHEWACFAAQQSAEKAIKGLHLFLGQEAWGHVVAQLMRELPTVPEENLVNRAKVLDNFYVSTRYPNGHPDGAPFDHYGPLQSNEALNHAREILAFVRAEMAG